MSMFGSTAPSEAGAAGDARIGAGLLALIACQVLAHWAVTRASASAVAKLVALAPSGFTLHSRIAHPGVG